MLRFTRKVVRLPLDDDETLDLFWNVRSEFKISQEHNITRASVLSSGASKSPGIGIVHNISTSSGLG